MWCPLAATTTTRHTFRLFCPYIVKESTVTARIISFYVGFKIVEGVSAKRADETTLLKKPLPINFAERLEKLKEEQRKRLEEVFPIVRLLGATDARWDIIMPDELLGWKFTRVREQKLEPLRNRIAHMISDPSSDLTLSPDSRENAREVTKWISVLRLTARVMIFNEKARIPPPVPVTDVPEEAPHLNKLQQRISGSKKT
jgi:hypothetical protein